MNNAVTYNEIFEQLNALKLCIYTPTDYILPSKTGKNIEKYDANRVNNGLTQSGREKGIRRLMSINLMKRMESSVHSFRLTLDRINDFITGTIKEIEKYEKSPNIARLTMEDFSNMDFDGDDIEDDVFVIGRKVQIEIGDMDYTTWKRELKEDKEILDLLISMVADITPEHDTKLKVLFEMIDDKQLHPINPGNKKILIFTAFADTANYLYESVSKYVKEKYNLNSAIITGSTDGKTTVKGISADFNTVLTLFSPMSKDKDLLMPNQTI